LKATKNASASSLAEKKRAMTISRVNPSILDRKVIKPTESVDLSNPATVICKPD
jgi:hypothetical protein